MYRYSRFSSFASRVARTLGHPATFMLFLGAALLWLATGPLFHFSGNWYGAYSNTATIVTTLLLFLIQHTQSREIASIQFKLNEIIRVSEGAHNALLDIEEMTDRDYDRIKASYTVLARQAREQLQSGKIKWATARVSMESLDSFFSPAASEEDEYTAREETAGAPALKVTPPHTEAFSDRLAATLDRMARVAAHSGHAPAALLVAQDKNQAWLLRQVGVDQLGLDAETDEAGEQQWMPFARLLAAQSAQARQPVLVGDTGVQSLPPEVSGGRAMSFMAVPLIGAHQRIMGCVAVVDIKPRQWRDTEIAALEDLAALTVEQLTEQARQQPAPVFAAAVAAASTEIALPAEIAPNSLSPAFVHAASKTNAQASEQANKEATEADTRDTACVDVPAAQGLAPATILVVDDSSSNRDLLRRRLEREGYCVLAAGNGHEALDCLQSEAVGLVLLDVMMPEMDGEEVLQHMQADDRLKTIPVIMVTALDEQDSVQRCLKAGAKDYVLKPLDPAQLRTHVHVYLPPPPRPAQTA